MDLLRVSPHRVLQRHDFLRKNLRLVIASVDFSNHQNGFVRRDQVAISVVVLVHHEHLHRTFEVLQRHHRVRFVGLFGDAVLDRGNQAPDARHAAIGQLRQRRCLVQTILLNERRVRR